MKAKTIILQKQRIMLPHIIGGLILILGTVGYLLAGMPTLTDAQKWKATLGVNIQNLVALPAKISAYNNTRLQAEENYNQEFYQKTLQNTIFLHDSLHTKNSQLYLNLGQTYKQLEQTPKAFTFYLNAIQESQDIYFRSLAYQQCGNLVFQQLFPSIINLKINSLEQHKLQEMAMSWLYKIILLEKTQKAILTEKDSLTSRFQKAKISSCANLKSADFKRYISTLAMKQVIENLHQENANDTEILTEICKVQTNDLQTLTEEQLYQKGISMAQAILKQEKADQLTKTAILLHNPSQKVRQFITNPSDSVSKFTAEKFLQSIQKNAHHRAELIEKSQHHVTTQYLVHFYDVILEFYARALKVFPQNDEARMNYEIIKELKKHADKKAQKKQPQKSQEEKQKEQQEQEKKQSEREQQKKQNNSENNPQNSDNQQNNSDKNQNSQTQKQNQNRKNQQSNGGESTNEDTQNVPNSQGQSGNSQDGEESQQQAQAGEAKEGNQKGTKEIQNVSELRSKNKKYGQVDVNRAIQSLKALEEREVQYLQQLQRRPRRTAPKHKKADW